MAALTLLELSIVIASVARPRGDDAVRPTTAHVRTHAQMRLCVTLGKHHHIPRGGAENLCSHHFLPPTKPSTLLLLLLCLLTVLDKYHKMATSSNEVAKTSPIVDRL